MEVPLDAYSHYDALASKGCSYGRIGLLSEKTNRVQGDAPAWGASRGLSTPRATDQASLRASACSFERP